MTKEDRSLVLSFIAQRFDQFGSYGKFSTRDLLNFMVEFYTDHDICSYYEEWCFQKPIHLAKPEDYILCWS